MNDNLKQSLSALMDDEASEFEVRRLLEQLDDDGTKIWSRYHLARSALSGDTTISFDADLSSRVSDVISTEPEHRFENQRVGWWKPLGNVAVAASVTAAVIFGAQFYQADSSPDAMASSQAAGVVLPGSGAINPNFLPAQYGRTDQVSSVMISDADVIRTSESMAYYIRQHEVMTGSEEQIWTATWVPDGYRPLRHEVTATAEVLLFSDGRTDISVSIEPFDHRKGEAGAIQSGDTVALGKRVGDRFVTVVGDLPLMIADRIASSIDTLVD